MRLLMLIGALKMTVTGHQNLEILMELLLFYFCNKSYVYKP